MNKIKQISIFLENKAGRLAKVTETLAEANINIHALSLADTTDFGILRLIVSDTENAKNSLKNAGFTVGITTVIAVKIENKPGGLNKVLQIFKANETNIEYMYALIHRENKNAVLIFRCQEEDETIAMLEKNGMKALSEDVVCGF